MNAITLLLLLSSTSILVPESFGALKISEIDYHPEEGTRAEWIEVVNRSKGAVTLAGVSLARGVEFDWPDGTSLEPGETCVVARRPGEFGERYPNFEGTVFGPYRGKLRNSGERVEIVHRSTGIVLDAVSFSDERPWPQLADGRGHTLERLDLDAPSQDPSTWHASCRWGGSPGAVFVGRNRNGVKTPVIYLRTAREEMREAFLTREGSGNDYRWRGTLVVEDGSRRVFEQVEFRLRGKSTRFYGRKRSLRIRLANGERFAGSRTLDLCAGRDSFGLGEALASDIFRSLGLPAPRLRFVELRITTTNDGHSESFGLYLVRDSIERTLLESPELHDAAIFELEGAPAARRASKEEHAELRRLRERLRSQGAPKLIDLERYVEFRAAAEVCGVRDLGAWNQFLVRPRGSGRWFLVPADLNGAFGAQESTNEDFFSSSLLPLVQSRVARRVSELRASDELDPVFEKIRSIARSIEAVVVADGHRWSLDRYRLRATTASATVAALIHRIRPARN